MKTLKKVLLVLAGAALLAGFVSCANEDDDGSVTLYFTGIPSTSSDGTVSYSTTAFTSDAVTEADGTTSTYTLTLGSWASADATDTLKTIGTFTLTNGTKTLTGTATRNRDKSPINYHLTGSNGVKKIVTTQGEKKEFAFELYVHDFD